MKEEEVRFSFLTNSYLVESFYLKHNGTKKEDIKELKRLAAQNQVYGRTRYYKKEELECETTLYRLLDKWKREFHLIGEADTALVYFLTIYDGCKKETLSQQQQFLLEMWNNSFLDGIRTGIQNRENIPVLSLGAGFYGMSIEMTEVIYQLLRGWDYNVRVKENNFTSPYTCSGIFLYGKNLYQGYDSENLCPCKTCRGTDNCDFCIFLNEK